jgi:hypothetical protein
MLEPKIGDRVLVASCKNCQAELVLLIDPTGHREVQFEDDASVPIECPHCRFTHLYGLADVRWARIAQHN